MDRVRLTYRMAGTKGASELALTPGPLHMRFPLCEPLFPEQSARLVPSVYLCGSHRLLQGPPRHHLSKWENERCPHPTAFSAPFLDNLYHQPAICHILSDVSVGMPSTSLPPPPPLPPPPAAREVSSRRAGLSVPTSVSSASIGPDM